MTRTIPLDDNATLLRDLGKDGRLVPYGGANFGMPLELIEPEAPMIVPTERFFVRSNGPVPVIDPASWALSIDGLVARSVSVTLADLHAMPRRTFTSMLECAGNGRTMFEPQPVGTPWSLDAAGCAVWEGVRLVDVLERAGVLPGAVDLVMQGGDFPEMQRGLPLAAALDPETTLAFAMNGEPLSVAHGGPVRLLVPGWAGIASTKWLVGITVLDRAFAGYWNADQYVIWSADQEPLRQVQQMPVRSVISRPSEGARVRAGAIEVAGYAWSGQGRVTMVEVSSDSGATWTEASLTGSERRGWVRFAATVEVPAGEVTLLARATDERGLRQPMAVDWNLKGYQNNSVQRMRLTAEG